MAGRQLIIRCRDGRWSASYSDQPTERFYGVTMQEAVDRLVNAHADRSKDRDQSASNGPDSASDGQIFG